MKIAFSVSFLGVFLLLILAQREIPAVKIGEIQNNSYGFLERQVNIEGKIVGEKDYSSGKTFKVLQIKDDSGSISLTCNCEESFLDKEVVVLGRVTEFKGEVQIEAGKIEVKG